MSKFPRVTIAGSTLVALVLAFFPALALGNPGGARLEGYLVDVDGRTAQGFRVHLIDASGRDTAQATTSDRGVYRFRDLEAGAYSLGIENTEGQLAPVNAPPVKLASNELARRDIKLVGADAGDRAAVSEVNHSFGVWWAGLSPATKAWSVVGSFIILGIALSALDSHDNRATTTQN
jgi:hypothetical protein